MENLRRLIETATREEWDTGMTWYATGRFWIADRARVLGTTAEVVAGVVSALSPNNFWERNLLDAQRFIQKGGDCVVCTFGRQKLKAQSILDGTDPLHVLKGPKELAFYDNFIDERSQQVAIDRHAWNALQGERQNQGNHGVRIRHRRYREAANAYRELAEWLGIYPYQAQAIIWEVWRNRL